MLKIYSLLQWYNLSDPRAKIAIYDRYGLIRYLTDHEIGTEIYDPVPLHLQECFRYLGHKPGDFPVSEEAVLSTLVLPIYPELTGGQIQAMVDRIAQFYGK